MVVDLQHVVGEEAAEAQILVAVGLHLELLGSGQPDGELGGAELMPHILVVLDRLRGTRVLGVHLGRDLEVGRGLLLPLLLGGLQGLVAAQPDGLFDEADEAVLVAEDILQGSGEFSTHFLLY